MHNPAIVYIWNDFIHIMPWAFKLCLAKVTGPSLLYMTVSLHGWVIWQLLTALSKRHPNSHVFAFLTTSANYMCLHIIIITAIHKKYRKYFVICQIIARKLYHLLDN